MVVEKVAIIKPGRGPKPFSGQLVTVHWTGYGKDKDLAKEFWCTKDDGRARFPQPFTFQIGQGQVIKGFDEGVLGMQLGELARLRMSPDSAFGAVGVPAWGILPDSFVEFKIEVLYVQ